MQSLVHRPQINCDGQHALCKWYQLPGKRALLIVVNSTTTTTTTQQLWRTAARTLTDACRPCVGGATSRKFSQSSAEARVLISVIIPQERLAQVSVGSAWRGGASWHGNTSGAHEALATAWLSARHPLACSNKGRDSSVWAVQKNTVLPNHSFFKLQLSDP